VVQNKQSAQLPLNTNCTSKRAVEEILYDFGVNGTFQAVVFRYFKAAGADIQAEEGEWHQPETYLIRVMIEAAACKRDAPRPSIARIIRCQTAPACVTTSM
jgi:UDP-glucose 4-epimerase